MLAGNLRQVAFKCEGSVHNHSTLLETERAGWQEGRRRDGEEDGNNKRHKCFLVLMLGYFL